MSSQSSHLAINTSFMMDNKWLHSHWQIVCLHLFFPLPLCLRWLWLCLCLCLRFSAFPFHDAVAVDEAPASARGGAGKIRWDKGVGRTADKDDIWRFWALAIYSLQVRVAKWVDYVFSMGLAITLINRISLDLSWIFLPFSTAEID